FLAEVGTNVEIGDSRAAAEPFQHASASEVDVERLDIDRNGAERLERVEHDVRSDFVRFFYDGFRVIDIRAAKNNMRDGDDQGAFVDGVEQAVGRHRDAVVRLDHVYLRSVRALSLPEVHDGGKVHVAVNDFVARAAEIEAGSDDGLAGGDVLMQRDGIPGRVHQGAKFVADFEGE